MKFINRVINKILEYWIKFKLLFVSKEKKNFAKKALDARHNFNKKVNKNRNYFKKLPRRSGFKKAPSFKSQYEKNLKRAMIAFDKKPKKEKKTITKEQHEAKELAIAKRTFFIELLSHRAKEIQRPFIKEKRGAKKARESSKTFQLV